MTQDDVRYARQAADAEEAVRRDVMNDTVRRYDDPDVVEPHRFSDIRPDIWCPCGHRWRPFSNQNYHSDIGCTGCGCPEKGRALTMATNLDDALATIRQSHRLISAHRCVCGWEGDDAITHVVDALGIEDAGDGCLDCGRAFLHRTGRQHTHRHTDPPLSRLYVIGGR